MDLSRNRGWTGHGQVRVNPRLLASARVRPYLSKMQIDEFMRTLESAWSHAVPGREAVERDHVLRQLWRELQRPAASDAAAPLLRLVRC
jgi:hypothetical protein